MNALTPSRPQLRRGIELGFYNGRPLIYDGTEPVAIDAQAGKGKLTRFLGVNLVSPRTAHLTKIVTDPKDAELAWVSWKTLERQGYRVRFINPSRLYGFPSETFNFNTRLRALTGGELGLLECRDFGFYSVAMPEFWERPEMSGMLRDVRRKPDKYAWLDEAAPVPLAITAPRSEAEFGDAAILDILAQLEG